MMTDQGTRSLVIERELPFPAERVWRALTDPSLLAEWLMANDFVAQVGHRFNFRATPQPHWNGVTDCEVLALEPGRRIAYRWDPTGADAASGLRTVVTWTLTPTPRGVMLRLEQSGFRPQDERNLAGARYGWDRFVGGLERVVAGLDD